MDNNTASSPAIEIKTFVAVNVDVLRTAPALALLVVTEENSQDLLDAGYLLAEDADGLRHCRLSQLEEMYRICDPAGYKNGMFSKLSRGDAAKRLWPHLANATQAYPTVEAEEEAASVDAQIMPSRRGLKKGEKSYQDILRGLFAQEGATYTIDQLAKALGADKKNASVAVSILRNPMKTKRTLDVIYDKANKVYRLKAEGE